MDVQMIRNVRLFGATRARCEHDIESEHYYEGRYKNAPHDGGAEYPNRLGACEHKRGGRLVEAMNRFALMG